ncbi:MAG: histidine kinase [Arenicellales bacterium]|nr:histidine kinase [Arenicellales bacterium]
MARSLQSFNWSVLELIPHPIGWSQADRDVSRRKFLKIISGLVCAALGVGLLGFCLVLFPEYAKTLWAVQLICLIVLFGFVLAALACARKCFFDPLGHVRKWASEIRQGNFRARVPVADDEGFGKLSDDINRLAEWLESLANDAEHQLKLQAERLSAKSQSLQLLYDAAVAVNRAPSDEQLIGEYLDSLRSILDARRGHAYIQTETGLKLITTFTETQYAADLTVNQSAGPLAGHDYTKIEVPLKYKDRILGKYELYVEPDNEIFASEVCELLPSIGRHLGMALEKTRLERESLRLEERAQLANELHDSLAQTLSALKFQVRLLDETMQQGDEQSIWKQMEGVEDCLEEATLELRDLIAQCRGRGSSRSINVEDPIAQVIAQFKRRSDIQVYFHDRRGNTDISTEMETQIARIIQEALTNAHKHSQASVVRVLLRCEANGVLEAIVEDNGVGFGLPSTPSRPGEHIGLAIMQERTDQLGGSLTVDSECGEGTRVVFHMQLPSKSTPADLISGVA